MSFINPIYHCSECKKIIENVEELLFVEENTHKGFCSESCIEKYYSAIIDYFEAQEKKIRKKYSLMDEPCLIYVGKQSYMESVLSRPKQIWKMTNDLGEVFYSFIGEFKEAKTNFQNTFYLIIICSVYDAKASFIFSATATKDRNVLKEFQFGDAIADPQSFVAEVPRVSEKPAGTDIAPEAMEFLESKKSSYLAELMEERSVADIPFEKFPLYEDYFDLTLENPDEVYHTKDTDGDEVFTYIKAHEHSGVSFYYFILLVKIDSRWSPEQDTLLPIVSFPTVDGEIYNNYRQGEQLSGGLKN